MMKKNIREYLAQQGEEPQAPTPAPEHRGWFKATRNPHMPDLIRTSRTAFLLAYMLAYRARWNNDAFNPFKLDLGEAVCDYHNWGLSEQEFRNGRDRLKAWGFATFRATSRGTIGKLIDTGLFSIIASQSNEQPNGQTTSKQRANQRPGQRHTKNKERRAENKEQRTKKDCASPQAPPHGFLYSKPSMKELRAYATAISKQPDCEGMDDPEAIKGFWAYNEKLGWRIMDWRQAFDGYCHNSGYSDVIPPPQASHSLPHLT